MRPVSSGYKGRFAPTPSGPLHLGSLFTALASWLAARQAGGEWFLRIDDLDGPRCVAGTETVILKQLEAHGLQWNGRVHRQSTHEADYREALERLRTGGWLYRCRCTRATLAATQLEGPDGPVYAGTCRAAEVPAGAPHSLRFRSGQDLVRWEDRAQGPIARAASHEIGDFVVRRADGQIGYHLACVLDEARMHITEVVRGADLIGATAQQLQLMAVLELPAPRYAHLPVLLAADGRKLSKQNGAAAIATDAAAVSAQLGAALAAMGSAPPKELRNAPAAELLRWAVDHWRPTSSTSQLTLPAPPLPLP